GDDELRAVLRVEQHAIAARDAAALLQIARERGDLVLQRSVGKRTAVIDDGRLVRIAARTDFEVVVEAGARDRERLWHPGRPMRKVTIEETHAAYFLTAFSFHFMPRPGPEAPTAYPLLIRTGSSITGSAQSTYSSQ